MKNTSKFVGIALFAAILVCAVSLTGCKEEDDPPTLTVITAAYTGTATIYPTTPLESLKAGLTVTAVFSDGSTQAVTDYTLSGTLAVGTSAVTVSYQGKTAAFNVIVTAVPSSETPSGETPSGETPNSGTTYTVTFNSNAGTPVSPILNVTHGSTIGSPADPTKANYSFGGWYKEGMIYQWNFASDTVTGNITLYAKWNSDIGTDGLAFMLRTASDTYSVSQGSATAAEVVIPSFYEGKRVTHIAVEGFINYTNMTGITIPTSVTNIGNYAFSNCINLTSITIPNSVTNIGSNMLSGCSSITNVTVPFLSSTLNGTATHVGYLFGASSYSGQNTNIPASLKSVIIAGGNSIASYAFQGCTDLTSVKLPGETGEADGWSVTIPNSVVTIGNYAFQDCIGLTSVTLPDNLTSIGTYVFSGCSSLPDIPILPAGVTSIPNYAFQNCIGLTNVTIPNSVASIGANVFSGCSGLTSITLPFVGQSKTATMQNALFGYIFGTNSYTGGTLTSQQYINSSGNAANITYYITTSLKTVIINGGSIGYGAFFGCSGLTNITIPNSVTSIGQSAFQGCSGLTGVTIPNSVTSIGQSVFQGCTGLTSITIPNSVTSISQSAFQGCSGLTSITIPNSVTSIGQSAFQGCSGLTNVTIPNSVTSIGQNAFQGCTRLTSITLPSLNYYIGYLFGVSSYINQNTYIPTSLKTVVITGANSIVDNAFYGCRGLTSITIPNSVTSIGDSAFTYCTGLTNVTIPNSVTSIGSSAFYGCTGLTSVTIPNSVTSIGSSAFYFCTGLTSVTIPNSVTSIGNSAFSHCTGLTSITIGTGVTTIATDAFSDCDNLRNITINTDKVNMEYNYWGSRFPADNLSVTFNANIVDYAFSDGANSKPRLTSVTIGLGVTSIGINAFKICTGLTSVTILNSVTSIGNSAFSNCTGLTSITIPTSVTSIGNRAFSNCTGLTNVTIPNSVVTIGNYAFQDCIGLTSVTLPDNLTSIGDSAFAYCTGLTNVTIPNSVTSIGDSAFYGCRGLTSITIPNSVTSIGDSAFYGCTGLTSVTIPNSVTSIGNSAFYHCTGLTNVTIPNSVTSIGNNAFSDTGLTSVTFATGSAITSENFGSMAFPPTYNSFGSDYLKIAYLATGGGAGTYTRASSSSTWTKQ